MTNAEKFKEVFGFEIEENQCCAKIDTCSDTGVRYDACIRYWQSEYKEREYDWIEVHGDLSKFYICEKHGCRVEEPSKFCPHCGAKMSARWRRRESEVGNV